MAGGAVEVFTCALLCWAGVNCKLAERGRNNLARYGRRSIGFLNVNGSFSGKNLNIKLVNTQGDSTGEWLTATLFVISGVGVVFGAPDMVAKEYLRQERDATALHKKGLAYLRGNPDLVLEMDIAIKPPSISSTNRASRLVAESILSSTLLGQYLHD